MPRRARLVNVSCRASAASCSQPSMRTRSPYTRSPCSAYRRASVSVSGEWASMRSVITGRDAPGAPAVPGHEGAVLIFDPPGTPGHPGVRRKGVARAAVFVGAMIASVHTANAALPRSGAVEVLALLAESGLGYDGIAALLGVTRADVGGLAAAARLRLAGAEGEGCRAQLPRLAGPDRRRGPRRAGPSRRLPRVCGGGGGDASGRRRVSRLAASQAAAGRIKVNLTINALGSPGST